jgi:hypothetical protein
VRAARDVVSLNRRQLQVAESGLDVQVVDFVVPLPALLVRLAVLVNEEPEGLGHRERVAQLLAGVGGVATLGDVAELLFGQRARLVHRERAEVAEVKLSTTAVVGGVADEERLAPARVDAQAEAFELGVHEPADAVVLAVAGVRGRWRP